MIEYKTYLQKENYSETTINSYTKGAQVFTTKK